VGSRLLANGGAEVLGGFGVPHSPVSAALARQRLCSLLSAQNVPDEQVEDVALLVSELVGNAVRHAEGLPSGGLHVDWEIRPGVIEVAVTDGGGRSLPRAREAGVEAPGGRGLAIVDAIASDWGVRRQGSVTTVWATIGSQPTSASLLQGSRLSEVG
jgi:anti-sigma regulatory factor (Ser/Thr protein kinase)